ncbi:solute carrier family 12 domain-containing protein [Ditylenchus destructor]|uniref:Solute carrier family 12 member 3 n=1 Tax=Ditylenchus destructor TaxID=166010 RepID=A0AAD4R1G0_9BILA|nr:solute carrier family 12 domain-containing protein [Ditylenchus destructor]
MSLSSNGTSSPVLGSIPEDHRNNTPGAMEGGLEGSSSPPTLTKGEQHRSMHRRNSLMGWLKIPKLMVNDKTLHVGNDRVHVAHIGSSASTGDLSVGNHNSNLTYTKATTVSDISRNGKHLDPEMAYGKNGKYDDGASSIASFDSSTSGGFGWVKGVLVRCILCIFGATLFLRMSWIAGQAGILLGAVIILLSFLVVLITAISMSAIATNGEVKNGGCYYLISRSLGPEFGGSIGLILYIANTVNASMNCVGLAETIVPILKAYGITLFDGGINDVRIYGLATCLVLQAIIFIGTEFENKTQMALMFSIIVSIVSHFVGTLLPTTEIQRSHGVVGYSLSVFLDNMLPAFSNKESFISSFGIYFPAMTGIMAGANMSGDLRDPSTSIPRGTFWAIAVTTVAYTWCMLIPAASTIRDANGVSPPVWNESTGHYMMPPCHFTDSCEFGLRNDYQIMTMQGAWSPLIIVGIFATTLSSASGCLIGAPRIFQALCADKLFPFIHPFAKGSGKTNDPFRAYILTFLIASGVILIGELNLIAELITNFFLAAFAITNFACFDASAAKSPGFRPGFIYYNKWLSLFGSILCVLIMFVLSWQMSLITFLLFIVLFLFIKNNKMHINWGSSTEANRYRKAFNSLVKITHAEEHVKNYRPQLLVLTGNPAARQALVDFANCITNGQNLMLCGHVIPHRSSVSATAVIRKLNHHFADWLYAERIKAFYCGVASVSLRTGVQCLLQTVGLGKMQPNILLLGYNNNWLTQCIKNPNQYEEYVGVISDAIESTMSVCVFRNENEGLDHSAILSEEDRLFVRLPDLVLADRDSQLTDDLNRGIAPRLVRPKAGARQLTEQFRSKSELHLPALLDRHHSENGHRKEPPRKKRSIYGNGRSPLNYKFRTKIRGGVVDVWWLFDDGGLTLLLSYLLTTQNTYLPHAKMRVFTICPSKQSPIAIHQNLVRMLKKFRIAFTSVQVLSEDIDRKLYPETVEEYEELMSQLNPSEGKHAIAGDILEATQERTMRYLRHRELILEYSSASSIVMISLPVASSSIIKSPVYMLWLELLSRDMPPMLFVRGNQTPVVTYYS